MHSCASQYVATRANWLTAANLRADSRCMIYCLSIGMP